jgi:hypothetical protein
MDMENYFNVVNQQRLKNPRWREGQLLYNTFYMLNPGMGTWITGKDIDPFYDDSKIESFLEFISKIP